MMSDGSRAGLYVEESRWRLNPIYSSLDERFVERVCAFASETGAME